MPAKTLSDLLQADDFVQQGASPAKGVVLLACTVGDDYDNPKNRTLVLQDGVWLEFTSEGDALLGVDASPEGDAYVLGEDGSVIEFDWRKKDVASLRASRKLYLNNEADKWGPLRQLRILGNDVLIAGSRGQVYRLNKGKFKALPRLEVEGEEDVTIEDLGGAGASSFIAVTLEGHAASFDGKKWSRLALPTNEALNNITPLGDGRFAIAGRSGTLLIGSWAPLQWHVAPPIDEDRDYYGVAFRDDRVYVAHEAGIDVYDGKKLKPVSLGRSRSRDFGKLRNGPDGVWAFQGHTVGVITATGWRQLK